MAVCGIIVISGFIIIFRMMLYFACKKYKEQEF